jgi:hypothetical protein
LNSHLWFSFPRFQFLSSVSFVYHIEISDGVLPLLLMFAPFLPFVALSGIMYIPSAFLFSLSWSLLSGSSTSAWIRNFHRYAWYTPQPQPIKHTRQTFSLEGEPNRLERGF